jgi:hypothetical protein
MVYRVRTEEAFVCRCDLELVSSSCLTLSTFYLMLNLWSHIHLLLSRFAIIFLSQECIACFGIGNSCHTNLICCSRKFRLYVNNDTPLCLFAARTHAVNQAFAPSRIIEPGCKYPRSNYQIIPHPLHSSIWIWNHQEGPITQITSSIIPVNTISQTLWHD